MFAIQNPQLLHPTVPSGQLSAPRNTHQVAIPVENIPKDMTSEPGLDIIPVSVLRIFLLLPLLLIITVLLILLIHIVLLFLIIIIIFKIIIPIALFHDSTFLASTCGSLLSTRSLFSYESLSIKNTTCRFAS